MSEFRIEINQHDCEVIRERLRQLPKRIQRSVLRKAMRAALQPVKAQVQQQAPVKSGATRKAVKIRAGKRSRKGMSILVQIGEGDFKGDQYYSSFQEYGYHLGPRWKGNNRKFVEGKHFMKKAFDATKNQAAQIATDHILEGCPASPRTGVFLC